MKLKLIQVGEAQGDAISLPDQIWKSMAEESKADRECFWVLHLNTKNMVIEKELISIGTLDSATVHPREVFKSAIVNSSSSIVTVHNHPSGDPAPSRDDLELWKRLVEIGKLVGIPVIDNIIIGMDGFYSQKGAGLLV